MILSETNGKTRIISQPAHAWISGQLATHWGNKHFGSFNPYDEVRLAAYQHDIGWTGWEQHPELNHAGGYPFNFMDMPLNAHLEIWAKGSKFMSVQNSYAALLILRHNLFLLGLHDFKSEPEKFIEEARQFKRETEAYEKSLLERVKKLYSEKEYDTRNLNYNQALIKTWDYLSLFACMNKTEEETMKKVPVNEEKSTDLIIRCTDPKRLHYTLKPWPLDQEIVEIKCECRYLNRPLVENGEVQNIYETYPPEMVVFHFHCL